MAGAAARDGTAKLAMPSAVADATRTVSVETQRSDITVPESLRPAQATVGQKRNHLICGYPTTTFLRSIFREVGAQNSCRFYRPPPTSPCQRDTSDGFQGVEISGLAYDNPRRGLELIGRDEQPEPSVD